MLFIDDGSVRHELEPLPDPGGSADEAGWRVAFAARTSLVEGPHVSFALRIGDEDLPLGSPDRQELDAAASAAPEAVPGDVTERLAAIATELSRRERLEGRIEGLSAELDAARNA